MLSRAVAAVRASQFKAIILLTHLLLMRHAKSSWANPAMNDHDRPLDEDGETDAHAMGSILQARTYAPQLIWCSDSQRTKQTASLLIRAIPGAQTVMHSREFYHVSAQGALDIAEKLGEPKGVSRLMWLGHNPGWSALHEHFTTQSHSFPAGSCAVLNRTQAGTDWLSPQNWRLIEFIDPAELSI